MAASPNAGLARRGNEMSDTTLNLVVIRSADLDRAGQFYQLLGLGFAMHRHGNGPKHLSSEGGGVVFEIYPQSAAGDSTSGTRIGFSVSSVDRVLSLLGSEAVLSSPQDSPWGRRAVIADPDGHRIELTQRA